MGYTVHHTICVTSCLRSLLNKAHAAAVSSGAQVSPIVDGVVNDVASFLVAPDGSKEGWEESDVGDKRRAEIKAWLRAQAYDDGSNSLSWFEVEHPEDGAPRVVDHQTRRMAKLKGTEKK